MKLRFCCMRGILSARGQSSAGGQSSARGQFVFEIRSTENLDFGEWKRGEEDKR